MHFQCLRPPMPLIYRFLRQFDDIRTRTRLLNRNFAGDLRPLAGREKSDRDEETYFVGCSRRLSRPNRRNAVADHVSRDL